MDCSRQAESRGEIYFYSEGWEGVCMFLFHLNLWYVTPNPMRSPPKALDLSKELQFSLAPKQIQQQKYENKWYSQEEE